MCDFLLPSRTHPTSLSVATQIVFESEIQSEIHSGMAASYLDVVVAIAHVVAVDDVVVAVVAAAVDK